MYLNAYSTVYYILYCKKRVFFVPRLQEYEGVMKLTVPKKIAELKGWKKGTVLEFRENMGNICLLEVR